MYKHRFQEALAGRPRAGKTYNAEAKALAYAGMNKGPVFIYNRGKRKDFKKALMIKPLSFPEHRKYIFTDKDEWRDFNYEKKLLYFWGHDGNIYHFKDFVRLYWGKMVAMKRVRSMDKYVFGAIHDYFTSTLTIIDDIAGIVRHGTSDQLSTLLSSCNHSGDFADVPNEFKSLGTDIIMMFHGVDRISPEIWKYITHVTMYPTTTPPKKDATENPELDSLLLEGWKESQLLPKHTAVSYFVDTYPFKKSIVLPGPIEAIHKKFDNV